MALTERPARNCLKGCNIEMTHYFALNLPLSAIRVDVNFYAGEEKPPKGVQTRLEVISGIAGICNAKELKSAAKAALSLGYLAAGDRSPMVLEAVATALLGLASKKGDELQFSVGEALCFAYGGKLFQSSNHTAVPISGREI